jgi:hypothetical protein
MDLIRKACTVTTRDLPTKALTEIINLCDKRFFAKTLLGESGAAEYLALLFYKWKHDSEMLILCCEAISTFLICTTENKALLSRHGIIRDILYVLNDYKHNWKVMKFICKLIIDLCNAKLLGVLIADTKSWAKDDGISTIASFSSKSFPDEELLLINNRLKFGKSGICPLIHEILLSLHQEYISSQHHTKKAIHNHSISLDEMIMMFCQVISTLSECDDNCLLFHQLETCFLLGQILLLLPRLPFNRTFAILYAIITLSADPSWGNKEQIGRSGIIPYLIEQLHDIMRHPLIYSNPQEKDYRKYSEYIAWSLLILVLECPVNGLLVKQITYAEVVFDNIISETVFPPGTRQKLSRVKEIVYCFDIY